MIDVTDPMKDVDRVRRSRAHYLAIAQASPCGVMQIDGQAHMDLLRESGELF
ncbi:hypothetical protein [Fulvimarina sp. MAC8]|uniref:hypothetical protein n=1 Tax=Fulvimarina sp. MAC8 TaxID=3162874 RepID=UPI0032EB88E7